MRVAINKSTTPLREHVEPLLDINITGATLIPLGGLTGSSGTAWVADGKILKTKGNVER